MPCCRNVDVLTLALSATIFIRCFAARVFLLSEKKELDFWTENAFFTSSYLKRASLFKADLEVLLIS